MNRIFIKILKQPAKKSREFPLLLLIHYSFTTTTFNSREKIKNKIKQKAWNARSLANTANLSSEIEEYPSSPPLSPIKQVFPPVSLPSSCPGCIRQTRKQWPGNRSRFFVPSVESCRESWAADRKALKPPPLDCVGRVFPSDFQVLRKVWKAVATLECCKRLPCPFIVARQALALPSLPSPPLLEGLSLLRTRIVTRTRTVKMRHCFSDTSSSLILWGRIGREAINRDVTR